MLHTKQKEAGTQTTVTVREPMNDYGSMLVSVDETNCTRHIVEYEDDDLETALAGLPAGSTLSMQMEQIETRGNCWRVTALRSRLA